MIRINLLPPEYDAAQSKREQQVLFGGAGIIIVTFLLIFWGVESRRSGELEKQVKESEAQLQKFQSINSQIEKIEADKQALSSKRDVIRNLNRSRLTYPVLFEDLLPIIPADVWVTNIQITDQSGQMKIVLLSNALSNFALATWLTNLQQSPHFSGVDLSPINYTTNEQGLQTLTFTINCTYQHKGPFPLADYN